MNTGGSGLRGLGRPARIRPKLQLRVHEQGLQPSRTVGWTLWHSLRICRTGTPPSNSTIRAP
eukprot:683772-Rhodomonas_salina.1